MTSTRLPAAYVRKSHKDAASADAQLAAIRSMAARHELTIRDEDVYQDVGVSGRHGERTARSAWARLNEAIATNRYGVVYVTALDRAGRSLREWLDFTELLVRHGVELRDQSGSNRVTGKDEDDIAVFEMMMAQREGRKAVERSARGKVTQQRRGDEVYQGTSAYGWMRVRLDANENVTNDPKRTAKIVEVPNPNEPVQPLLDAIHATRGNVLQAARRLDALGIPTRSGGSWEPKTLTRALDRAGALRSRHATHKRRGAPSNAPLSKLVACHCGETMTPERDRRSGQWLGLVCAHGRKRGFADHGRYVARSRHVLDRLRSDLTMHRVAFERAAPTDTSVERAALEARKRKLGTALLDDAVSEDDYALRMAAIKRDLARLDEDDADAAIIGFTKAPWVDWTTADAEVGESLRRIVREVRLNEAMMPAKVEYRQPYARALETRRRRREPTA